MVSGLRKISRSILTEMSFRQQHWNLVFFFPLFLFVSVSSLLLIYANIHLCRYNHTVISGVTNKLTDTGKKCVVCVVLPQMNAVDTLGQTALHRAALAGHLQTCRMLLSYGADPAVVSLQGFTAAQMGNEAVQQILNGKRNHSTLTARDTWTSEACERS